MNAADVSVIVIPRERFSMARESLESLLATLPAACPLIYIDGNGPAEVKALLAEHAQRPGFRCISRAWYLSNNQSRNLGWREITTRYVVFCDNDVIFAPGWLEALWNCAETTGADVVAPLTCEGYPAHTRLHYAGGEYVPMAELADFHADVEPQRLLQEKQFLLKEPLARWRHTLQAGPTGFCEPHCIFARSDTLRRLGDKPFDEAMPATKEHLDFCMSVRQAGGSIWFEPASCVTFMLPNPARPIRLSDIPFYCLRWSDRWQRRSIAHFNHKWRLGRSDFSLRLRSTNYRREFLILYYLQQIPWLGRSETFCKLMIRPLRRMERIINDLYTAWFAFRHPT